MPKTRYPYYILSVSLLLGLLVYYEYYGELYRRWFGGNAFFPYFALYGVPFLVAFGLQYLFFPGLDFHRKWQWWAILFGAPALFALRSSLHLPAGWGPRVTSDPASAAYRIFFVRSIGYMLKALCLIVPLVIFWFLANRRRTSLYGLGKPETWRPVNYLLLLMIPLVLLAAAQPSFLSVYPKARLLYAISTPDVFSRWYYLVFEGSYGLDLFSMEFFFRGFLILGMLRICKTNSIIPAAVFYCTVHFGSPVGECISSYFGAMLLAFVALRARSIYPGVVLHLALAWGMELAAAVNLPSLLR